MLIKTKSGPEVWKNMISKDTKTKIKIAADRIPVDRKRKHLS